MPVPATRSFSCFILTSCFVILLAAGASAGEVTGRVVDPDGRPVPGAQVLVSGDGVPLQSVTTGDDGRFVLVCREDARLRVRVAVDGFRAAALDVEPSAAARDLGTITLGLSAVAESVVVSASQVEVPLTEVTSSVTVVTGAEIKARQLHSLADVLRTVPGLSVAATGGTGATTGVFPRGGESNYTLVLIDGIPANVFGGDFDFGQVATANVERVEIVRGPQSAIFGSNAIGAVVRLVTRRGGSPSALVSAEAGQLGTSRISASTSGERGAFAWGGFFDGLLSDGLNGTRSPAGESIVNDDYERRTGGVSAAWQQGGAHVGADVRHSRDERGFPGAFGSNPIGAFGGIDAISRGRNERTLASVSAAAPLTSRFRGLAQLAYAQTDSRFVSPFDASDADSRRWSGRVQTDIHLGRAIETSVGLELQRERAGSTYISGTAFQPVPIKRTTAGYFAEARWSRADRVFATGGVRVEDIRRPSIEASSSRPALPADRVTSVNPRASVAWLPRGAGAGYTRVRGAISTGIRPPDAFELAFTDNPDLRPERSLSAEAGVDQAFASGLGLLEATAFFNQYDDLIVAVGPFTGSSQYRTDNISNARARGLETALTLRGRVAARRPVDLLARIAYTWLDTGILAVDDDDVAPPPFEVGQRLLRRPRHTVAVDLSATAARFSAFVRGGGRSAVLDVEPSLGTFGGLFDAAGYHAWTAGGAWRLTAHVELFARVENVFDHAYEEALGFPAPGRRVAAGIRVAAGR